MQSFVAGLTSSLPKPSLRAEIEIHSLDYEFPQAVRPPIVKSRSETAQAAAMPDKPVLSTASSSCSAATNAPSFQARLPSSDSSQRATGAKEKTATKPTAKSVTAEWSSPHRQTLSPAAEVARKNVAINYYLQAIGENDVKAVGNCIKDDIKYFTLDKTTTQRALWLAVMNKNVAMVELITSITSHSAKLDVMTAMLNLRQSQRAALKPGVDAIMRSYQRQEAGSTSCSSTEKAEAERVRAYL